MLFALIFILLGVLFLLKNLGIITAGIWGILWPLILILIGFWIIFLRYEWRLRTNKVAKKIWKFIASE